jgi:Flp pilus assembly protein TadG
MRFVAGNRRRSGASLVEFAVVAPVFLMMVMAVIEFGRFVSMRQAMEHAVREGCRVAVVRTADFTTADIDAKTRSSLGAMVSQLRNINVRVFKVDPGTGNMLDGDNNVVTNIVDAPFYNAQFGQGITVRMEADYPTLMFQGVMSPVMQLRASAVMYSEAN